MIRAYDLVLASVVIASASATFWVKYDSRSVQSDIRGLEKRIVEERAAIELGEAEWSVLAQPDRVQALAEIHAEALALRPIDPDQLVTEAALGSELDALVPNSVEEAIADLIEKDLIETDEIATGAVQ